MRLRSAYALVFLLATALALVPALIPPLDIAAAGVFLSGRPELPLPAPWWVETVNEYTPTVFRVLTLACIPAWALTAVVPRLRRWGRAVAFVGFTVALGPGLLTTGVKEVWQRARPFHVTEFGGPRQFTPAWQPTQQCEDNCAFVSGHVACGFFFATLMLIDPRRRWHWAATGALAGGLIAYARISVGAHWLSDALWAFPVTLAAGPVVWWGLTLLYGPPTQDAGAPRP